MFEMHVLVSIVVCHLQTLVLNKNAKIVIRDSDIDDIETEYLSFDNENYKTFPTIFPHVSIFLFIANTSLLLCYPLKKQKS